MFGSMRVSSVIAFVVVACAALPVRAAEQPADETSVSVNVDALPTATPKPKPTAADVHPLSLARPRPKPTIDLAAQLAAGSDTPTTAEASVSTPLPRWKPGSDVAPVQAAVAPAQPAEIAPGIKTAAPPAQPAVPVSLVKPVTDETFPVEITGIPEDPNASRTPIDPTAGFAILSRVRFSKTGTDLSEQAHTALDALAERLINSRERVRLAAFSGKPGADTSDARRLSLTRALVIRAYLVSKGVPIERVDVLAFGGPAKGVTDRVDVLVRGI